MKKRITSGPVLMPLDNEDIRYYIRRCIALRQSLKADPLFDVVAEYKGIKFDVPFDSTMQLLYDDYQVRSGEVVHGSPGEHMNAYSERLVAMYKRNNIEFKADFNG